MKQNRMTYAAPDVVRHYTRASRLQPAEQAILEAEGARFERARLLDLGVGAGRTTGALAPRVRTYLGLDLEQAMVDACRARFAREGYAFEVGDATALSFEDASFDVVFFSFNGIDYVDGDGRARVLGEVRRVLSPGGLFVFSTHNLDRDDLEFDAPEGEGLVRSLARARGRARLRAHNPDHRDFARVDHAMVNDGAFDFRLVTYHIRLRPQIGALARAGFERVTAWSGRTGAVIPEDPPSPPTDPWLYFTCHAPEG